MTAALGRVTAHEIRDKWFNSAVRAGALPGRDCFGPSHQLAAGPCPGCLLQAQQRQGRLGLSQASRALAPSTRQGCLQAKALAVKSSPTGSPQPVPPAAFPAFGDVPVPELEELTLGCSQRQVLSASKKQPLGQMLGSRQGRQTDRQTTSRA